MFAAPAFLNQEECSRLIEEMRAAPVESAAVVRGASELVDEESRRTRLADVPPATTERMRDCLGELKQPLERHFDLALAGCESPQFLLYRPGDFFGAHVDASDREEKPQFVRDRKISVVVFLNSASPEPRPGTFDGGALTLYGLMPDPAWQKYGFSLKAQTGLLVAFRSSLWHAVEPVSRGERFTMVSWFY